MKRRSHILIIFVIGLFQLKLYHLKPEILNMWRLEKFQISLHLIHHWKGLQLEIPCSEYLHDQKPTAETTLSETIPSQTRRLKHVDIG